MLRFVLVETSHPGNIGATARALKTMGQPDWVLVSPRLFPHPDATAMASGASDWLDSVPCVQTLAEAVGDCHWVIGTSTRLRAAHHGALLTPRVLAERIRELRSQHTRSSQSAQSTDTADALRVALVFGTERTGLSNEQLDHCHELLTIPADPDYPSLNLSQAIQIIAYELRVAGLFKPPLTDANAPVDARAPAIAQTFQAVMAKTQASLIGAGQVDLRPLATERELWLLEEHVFRLSERLGFTDQSGHLLTRIRRIIHRAGLEQAEVNILRGILKTLERQAAAQREV